MKLSERLSYYALSALCGTLSLLPLRALYILSDVLSLLAHKVVRYRVAVVRENLSSSFPEKSEAELRKIERGFYRFLADYFFETVKLYFMSPKFIERHLKLKGLDKVNDAVEGGRSCTLYLGHYCNWEWVSSLPLHISPKAECAQIYHPLSDKGADRFFYRLRTRFHANNVAMEDTFRVLLKWKKAGIPSVTGYIADQAPGLNVHLFIDFLNHDTGVYTGPERISRFLDAEVFYCHMTRPRRGYYELEFIPITSSIKESPMFEPSRVYFRLLEKNIREQPEFWLWSHRRWKRSRQMFNDYFGDKAADQLSHL